MSPLIAEALRLLFVAAFEAITHPGSEREKIERLERATLALGSKRASEALIDGALKL